jgi:hypothetical protein
MKTDTTTKKPEARKRVFDPTTKPSRPDDNKNAASGTKPEEKPPFRVWTLVELRKQEEPEGWNLVGDYHITRGSITVLAGSPGIGKSFATLDLAIKGATGTGSWLGYSINNPFKTLIIQAENSRLRMIMDAKRVQIPEELNEHVKILEFSWGDNSLGNSKLVDDLRKLIVEFEPDLVIFDPWNQFADDDKAKETKAAMDSIKYILDAAKNPPACLIVAHHRKKREGDAHKGRQMADLISGSYVMQSNPRCVLCYVAYDPTDENDNRVVVLCPKKNNGKHKGPATAWTLCEHGFEAIADFDYKAWQDGSSEGKESKAKIRQEHLQAIFANGALTRSEAGKKLETLTTAGRSAVSEALTKRFADMIEITGGGLLLNLKEEYRAGASFFEDGTDERIPPLRAA